ncbi:succinylglutamate desuccinylase/aspartoacylase family protein [Marinihelvus fidelis]|uniref:Succinylglutamate desuccinylase/aspartoacylase family protein n=1 Tax=Marinihelvus fidelis TaxID=2613842 RepID=A0A5N0TDF0_9GAMM|nr:succinylglutamate desuccinylase/aspartoacylase family protein [Marinihelvus fidelis]KAA9132718.1 succinylglutamate desuccinylase/aspartoacylase family protein [Marinihelvus fidelis]
MKTLTTILLLMACLWPAQSRAQHTAPGSLEHFGQQPEPEAPAPEPVEQVDDTVTQEATYSILGKPMEPGEFRQFNWQLETAMAGLSVPTPVLVARGRFPGPTLCLVAAVHGDELNGVEIVRRIMFDLDRENLHGIVVGIPIANAFGFLRGSRYLPDRRDLNRFFPGQPSGSMASRFAHALFGEVIRDCHVLVDIHTGSFNRTNLPQLRADLGQPDVVDLSRQFGDIVVLHSEGPKGSLRGAATAIGIPAVTMEAGGPSQFQATAVDAGVDAIGALLDRLDMVKQFRLFRDPQPVFYESDWVRAESGGILLGEVELGDEVLKGQRLGTVTDPIENRRETLYAPYTGRILGMALNQVVMPGFAAFHIGRATTGTGGPPSPSAGEDPDGVAPGDTSPGDDRGGE